MHAEEVGVRLKEEEEAIRFGKNRAPVGSAASEESHGAVHAARDTLSAGEPEPTMQEQVEQSETKAESSPEPLI